MDLDSRVLIFAVFLHVLRNFPLAYRAVRATWHLELISKFSILLPPIVKKCRTGHFTETTSRFLFTQPAVQRIIFVSNPQPQLYTARFNPLLCQPPPVGHLPSLDNQLNGADMGVSLNVVRGESPLGMDSTSPWTPAGCRRGRRRRTGRPRSAHAAMLVQEYGKARSPIWLPAGCGWSR
jgi:hypothetical protein